MATTEHFYAGTGTQTSFPFEFPYLTESDVFVKLYNSSTGNFDLKQLNTSGQNNDYSISNTNIVFNTAPPQIAGVNNIHIYRNTDVETAKAVYNTGSAIRAQDLNNNTDQSLYKLQEGTQLINTDDIKDEAINSAKIKDETIVNADVSPTAEIAVSKLADGSARQLLQTDAAGTGVEWTSNVDIPGTLDVTGNTDIDGTLNVDGNATLQGTTTLATVDINAGNIDNTVIGATTPVNANFNYTTTSSATVSAYPTDPTAFAIHLSNNIISANPLRLSSYQEPDSNGNALGNNATTQVLQNLSVAGDLSVTGSISGSSIDATSLATIPAANFVRADQSDVLSGHAYTFAGALPNTTTVNRAIIRGRDLKLEFGNNGLTESNLSQSKTMTIQAQRHGVMDNNGNYASINDINLGAGNLGLPWGASELNSNQIGHVSRISLGRAYMTVAKANNVYSTDQLVMRASYPDGLMFYHPDTPTTGAEYYLSGSNMPGDATYGNSYEDNITEARNNADMRIIQGGILAKNKVEIGSSTVTGTLQISGTDVTSTATELNKLDGYTGTTTELNKLDGYTGSTADLNEVVTGKNVVETITGSATDAQLPTAQAVNERIVELVTEVGGFHPITNETSFPTTNPDINDGAGTIVSIADAGGLKVADGSGSGTYAGTAGNSIGATTTAGNAVTITGIDTTLRGTTIGAGKGMLVETTTTLNEYAYHRLVLDESGVANADTLVSAFNERYYGPYSANQSTRPSGANRVNGDLYFNTSDGKMKVFNGSHATGTWDDVAAPGNFFINTLSSSSGSGGGSATFNGTATRFTLSNPPLTAQQLLVSVNGVIQKPNSGTSPSEGFAIDSADIIFASAPANSAPYFIVTIGSSVNIGTPSNDTVGAAQIIDGSISNAEISSSAAIAKSKLASLDIVNADVNASAAIAKSKLASLDIINADVNASAAIAGSKINPVGLANVLINTTQAFDSLNGRGNLVVGSGSGNEGMTIYSGTSNTGGIVFADGISGTAAYMGQIAYEHSNNSMVFKVNEGGTRMTIDSSGNVGIGTTSPAQRLVVHAGSDNSDVAVLTGGDVARGLKITTSATSNTNDSVVTLDAQTASHGTLAFAVANGSEAMRIDSSGRVGIGTTSPVAPLHVAHSGTSTSVGTNFISLRSGASGRDIGIQFADTATSAYVGMLGGAIYFADSGSSEKMRIDSNGKVGIGTTSPAELLHLQSTAGNTKLRLTQSGSTTDQTNGVIQFGNATDAALCEIRGYTSGSNNSGYLQFLTTSSGTDVTAMTINTAGNVGIGTSSPSQNFTLKGFSKFEATNSTNGWVNYTYTDNTFRLNYNGAGNDEVTITSSGNVGINNSNPQNKLLVTDGGSLTLPVIQSHITDSNGGLLGFGLYSDINSKFTFSVTNNGRVHVNDGIDFNMTSNATGMTSELLDDYEEGTWTPTYMFGGTTASTQPTVNRVGHYTKIGDRVFISCHIAGAAVGTFSGGFQIGGLPFNNASGKYAALCGWVYSGFDNNHLIIFRTNPNQDRIEVQYPGNSVLSSNMNHSSNYMIGGNYAA